MNESIVDYVALVEQHYQDEAFAKRLHVEELSEPAATSSNRPENQQFFRPQIPRPLPADDLDDSGLIDLTGVEGRSPPAVSHENERILAENDQLKERIAQLESENRKQKNSQRTKNAENGNLKETISQLQSENLNLKDQIKKVQKVAKKLQKDLELEKMFQKPTKEEEKRVLDQFQNSRNITHNILPYRIERIVKIDNPKLLKSYDRQRSKMIEMDLFVPKGFVNEHPLFHGTKSAHAIIKDGFSLAQSKETGLLGGGIYFADQSTKSHLYTSTSGTRTMLLCKVITGTQYKHKTETRADCPTITEKRKFSSEEFFREYQSVSIIGKSSNLIKNNEIAIYKSDQAYPEYLIEYTV